jgi:excinuclease ABC subunit B
MSAFNLISEFRPCGDQPKAIEQITAHLENGTPHTVLLGITGSGKTFTMAHVIARVNRPTLILAPNKTLAAQLYNEFADLFPHDAVHYFVSYYDYYQPEAYMPASDTYIAKDAAINDEIDRMRHAATNSLFNRRNVIIVASVSCIFGIGSSDWYDQMSVTIEREDEVDRDEVLRKLVDIHYRRNEFDFARGTFRVRGDVVEIFPVYEEDLALRVEWFGDEVEQISRVDPLRGRVIEKIDSITVRPASHYVTPASQMVRALQSIKQELGPRLAELRAAGKLVEAQRLEERTLMDLEMLDQMGYCPGIENYSRHLSGRQPGEPPPTLLDYFPDDFLLFIDESHQTIPQLGGMYRGDRSRKQNLVEYGFRLPSALDNRPLKFEEFEQKVAQTVYVSATPGDYELAKTQGSCVEQIVRPTGLLDPAVEVRPTANQIDDLLSEIRCRADRKQRVLVTTLTKRMAEELTDHYLENGVRVRYLHSDIDTLERAEILRDLRRGNFDVLVGINLLREGLDLPEVSLVAILDADKEGFLRNARSLIQTMGRASRNVDGQVIMYAEKQTAAMQEAIGETGRRRERQEAYNQAHDITPRTIQRAILELAKTPLEHDYTTVSLDEEKSLQAYDSIIALRDEIVRIRKKMQEAARKLDFEAAAKYRDRLKDLQEQEIVMDS